MYSWNIEDGSNGLLRNAGSSLLIYNPEDYKLHQHW